MSLSQALNQFAQNLGRYPRAMPLPQSQTKVRKISDVISRFGCLVPANTHISGHG